MKKENNKKSENFKNISNESASTLCNIYEAIANSDSKLARIILVHLFANRNAIPTASLQGLFKNYENINLICKKIEMFATVKDIPEITLNVLDGTVVDFNSSLKALEVTYYNLLIQQADKLAEKLGFKGGQR